MSIYGDKLDIAQHDEQRVDNLFVILDTMFIITDDTGAAIIDDMSAVVTQEDEKD